MKGRYFAVGVVVVVVVVAVETIKSVVDSQDLHDSAIYGGGGSNGLVGLPCGRRFSPQLVVAVAEKRHCCRHTCYT